MLLKAKTESPATASATSASEENRLLHFDRVYTRPGVHPFDQVQWEKRERKHYQRKRGSDLRAA